jgi:cell division protein FtsL
METTANTSSYMIAGFVVSFVTMGIYVISLYLRSRNLKQDIETLESMQNEKPKSSK